MHQYNIVIYGIHINTNYDICKALKLSIIKEDDLKVFKDNMILTVSEDSSEIKQEYGIIKDGEKRYYYNIPGCSYTIMKNAINVCCSDASIFLETFLNVPLSIYVLLNKLGIILHCSSVFKDKMVYAFSGKKGIGKSSILQTFLKLDDLGYDFYSDDTIRLKTDDGNHCYPSIPIIKLLNYGHDDNNKRLYCNSVGKYFVPVKNGVFKAQYFNAYELQKVIFLGNRSMKLQRRGIDNKNIIIPLLCSNISGYNQLPEELKKECIVQPCSRKEATDGEHDKPYHKCHVGERNHRRILIVIGNVLGKGVQTICFLVPLVLFQGFGGGYHCQTHLRCWTLMVCGLLAALFVLQKLPVMLLFLGAAISACPILAIAPVLNAKAPFSESFGKRMHRISVEP